MRYVVYVGIQKFIRFVEVNLPDKFRACDVGVAGSVLEACNLVHLNPSGRIK